jgi:hypothetical protein
MRWWPFRRRRPASPSDEARCALEQAQRALADAQRLGRAADDLGRRADEIRDQWQAARDRNHVAEAVVESILRRARRP